MKYLSGRKANATRATDDLNKFTFSLVGRLQPTRNESVEGKRGKKIVHNLLGLVFVRIEKRVHIERRAIIQKVAESREFRNGAGKKRERETSVGENTFRVGQNIVMRVMYMIRFFFLPERILFPSATKYRPTEFENNVCATHASFSFLADKQRLILHFITIHIDV